MKSATARPDRTKAERDDLVERYLPLVRHVVARLPLTMPATLDRDDFFSVGVMGLMHAAATWDPARGASFKTFAYTAIRGAVLDEIRKHDPVPRNRRDRLRRMERATSALHARLGRAPSLDELATELDVSATDLDDDLLMLHTCRVLSIDDSGGGNSDPESNDAGRLALSHALADSLPGPSDRAATGDDVDAMARAIGELPETERHVVVLYHYEDLYLKEIGEVLGVTESRVSQILTRATARLRLRLRGGEN